MIIFFLDSFYLHFQLLECRVKLEARLGGATFSPIFSNFLLYLLIYVMLYFHAQILYLSFGLL